MDPTCTNKIIIVFSDSATDYCENMSFMGSKHVLFSETDDNNS